MRLQSQISVMVVVALLAIGLAGTATAGFIAMQNATATYSLTDYSWGGIASSINGIDDGTSGDGWHTFDQSHTDQIGCFETVSDASGSSWTFNISNHNLYRWPNEPDENRGTKKFRLSYTTADRDTFADGLQNGGDVDTTWTVINPTSASSDGASVTATINGDGSISWTAPNPVYTADTKTVTWNGNVSGVTGFRLELLSMGPNAGEGLGYGNGLDATVITEFTVGVPEPNTIVMLTIGLFSLLAYAWRKRK